MKTFSEAYDQFYGRISRAYSADFKMIPPRSPQVTKMRKMRAKTVTWDLPPDPRGQTLTGVNFSDDELKDREAPKKHKEYAKKLRKMRRKREMQNEQLNERAKFSQDPPFVLNLKRVNIRLFPNDVKVALYFNEQLKKYFSVTYGGNDTNTFQAEEISIEDLLISLLESFQELTKTNQEKLIEILKEDPDVLININKFLSND